MKPRILLVVTRAELGGAQRVVQELAAKLVYDGYPVTVAAGEEGWLLNEAKKIGCKTYVFKHLARNSNLLAVPLFINELHSFLSRQPHEVVHLNSSNALAGSLGAKLARAHVVFTVHGLSMLDSGYRTNPLLKFAYKLWFRLWFMFVDVVVAVSQNNAQQLTDMKLANKKLTVVQNGVDLKKLHFHNRPSAREEIGISNEASVVMAVGRLEYAKRIDVLIRAWKEVVDAVPDAILVLVGDGPERQTLESLVRTLGLEEYVLFVGSRPRAHELMHAADILALPSRYEGWPIVLLEALAGGVTIVASDVGGIAEQIGEAGVLLAPDAKATDWANTLIPLLADQDELTRLSALALHRGRQWNIEGMAKSYEALYE
jgi:glycosyltransferase involved in cell wall biosynthesis